jgi:hypothetical protein
MVMSDPELEAAEAARRHQPRLRSEGRDPRGREPQGRQATRLQPSRPRPNIENASTNKRHDLSLSYRFIHYQLVRDFTKKKESLTPIYLRSPESPFPEHCPHHSAGLLHRYRILALLLGVCPGLHRGVLLSPMDPDCEGCGEIVFVWAAYCFDCSGLQLVYSPQRGVVL